MTRDEIEKTCIELYPTHSAKEIATVIGNGFTRNAVAGVWNRLGLRGKLKSGETAPETPLASKPACAQKNAQAPITIAAIRSSAPAIVVKAPAPKPAPQIKSRLAANIAHVPPRLTPSKIAIDTSPSAPATLIERKSDGCCFAIKRNEENKYVFCNQTREPKSSWCNAHKMIVYINK